MHCTYQISSMRILIKGQTTVLHGLLTHIKNARPGGIGECVEKFPKTCWRRKCHASSLLVANVYIAPWNLEMNIRTYLRSIIEKGCVEIIVLLREHRVLARKLLPFKPHSVLLIRLQVKDKSKSHRMPAQAQMLPSPKFLLLQRLMPSSNRTVQLRKDPLCKKHCIRVHERTFQSGKIAHCKISAPSASPRQRSTFDLIGSGAGSTPFKNLQEMTMQIEM